MRLMQLISLKHLVPQCFRPRLRHFWSGLLTREQLVREKTFYGQFIRRGDLVFDVGANTGSKTAAFLSLGARVVAVEPNPLCADEIRIANKEGLATGALTIENVAVASSRRDVKLTVFEGHSDISSGCPEFVEYAKSIGQDGIRTITVPAVTLDDLIARYGLPDFIKVDVEGMDAEVLMGLHQKPKHLTFEYHTKSPIWENTRRCFAEAERLGFVAANLTEFASPKLLLSEWLEIKSAGSEIRRRFGNSDHWGDVVLK